MYSSCANSEKKQLYKLIYSADGPSSCNLSVSNGVKGTATAARIKKKECLQTEFRSETASTVNSSSLACHLDTCP